MTLEQWIIRWGIPAAAERELREALAGNDMAPAQAGVWLTRNNVGVLQDETGRPVRYGLANESKAQNEHVKSADLIGFRKRVIVPSDVGATIAQFVSRECKAEGWQYRGSKREVAQARWRDFINANGGDAAFVSGPGSFIHTRETR
jgi:hypothetical protein